MSKFTEELVDNLADKLLIGLSREENKMVLDEMEQINKTVSIVEEIEGLENIEPMTHCLDDFIYTLREDAKDEESISGNLLVKSGMFKKIGIGGFWVFALVFSLLNIKIYSSKVCSELNAQKIDEYYNEEK